MAKIKVKCGFFTPTYEPSKLKYVGTLTYDSENNQFVMDKGLIKNKLYLAKIIGGKDVITIVGNSLNSPMVEFVDGYDNYYNCTLEAESDEKDYTILYLTYENEIISLNENANDTVPIELYELPITF